MPPYLAIAVLAVAIASGCAREPGPVVPVEVSVPVYCQPREVPRPAMPVDALPESADVFEVSRALWAEVEAREAYEIRLRDALDACKEKPPA